MVTREGYGNDGFMESVEKQKQLFPSSHAPLEISPTGARFPHSHSPASPRMEKWKTTIRFSTFPRGSRDDSYGLFCFGTKHQATRLAASRPPLTS
jgi:hypothetical protein